MIVKISFFISFLYLKNSNSLIFERSYFNFNSILKILYKNTYIFLLNNSLDYKYSWSKFSENDDSDNEINLNFFNKNNNMKIEFLNNSKNSKNVYNLIMFKKKTSLIKKIFDSDYIILNRLNNYKNNFNYLNNYTLNPNNNILINNKKDNFSIKTVDFKKKAKMFYNTNRLVVKKFLNIKKKKQHAISKKLKFICNLKKNDFVMKLENNVFNIVMQSDFFFSSRDFNWFFKNGFIYLNSSPISNHKVLLKPYDIIQIVNFSQYYYYYKNSLSYLIANSFIISKKLWNINRNRYKTAYFKDVKTLKYIESYPKILENYKYFKSDVPNYLEVDYVTMTIILLYYNKKINLMNFYNLKFFNFYLNRLYNWNYIV